jgi:serine/threonine protein kinase
LALGPGTRLGVYEVTALLGEGGMGQVYRATDTRLKRQVAIKILPPSVAADHDRLARFQREAEMLASLNHPNIAGIYGLEESGSATALVMELVEGEELSAIIARGPIHVAEALAMAKQIAEALEAAHEHGIIHRDLKPANVKVREDGTVKVLDFGLAKAIESIESAGTSASISLTITSPAVTGLGIILGTAAYMSPEQAKGRAADRRADVWAFGAVFYEMLTGRRAFEGEGVSETLANVIHVEPAWEALPAGLAPSVVALLRRCLAKDPKKRMRDIGDVGLALDGAFDFPITAPVRVPLSVRAALIALVLALSVGAFTLMRSQPPSEPDPIRFSNALPGLRGFRNTDRQIVAIAPDGRRFAYNASGGLYIRKMDEEEPRLIPGTEEGLFEPMFSPDGGSLAYFQGGALKKVLVDGGGTPVPLGSVGLLPLGASWGADNTIVWGQNDGIWQISGAGGVSERIVQSAPGERLSHPQLLPGREWLLFTSQRGRGSATVARSLKSGTQKVVVDGAVDARYLATGHLVYFLPEGGLFASAFDLEHVVTTGGTRSVLRGVGRADETAAGYYGIASNGTLVYVLGGVEGQLVWVDRAGKKVGEVGVSGTGLSHPALSPDGAYVAYEVQRGASREVVRYSLATTSSNTLSGSEATDDRPVWSPSGEHVVFNTSNNATREIVGRRADGADGIETLVTGPIAWTGDWQRFGSDEYLLFDRGPTGERSGLWYQKRFANSANWEPPVRFHGGPHVSPKFSPNGRYVAYVLYSGEPGGRLIEVVSFPDAGKKWTISKPGASRLRWSRDGRELFYVAGEALMKVSVSTNGMDLAPAQPEPLFSWRGLAAGSWDSASFDVSRDGRRFLVMEPLTNQGMPTLHVVLNWFTELKRLVPAR